MWLQVAWIVECRSFEVKGDVPVKFWFIQMELYVQNHFLKWATNWSKNHRKEDSCLPDFERNSPPRLDLIVLISQQNIVAHCPGLGWKHPRKTKDSLNTEEPRQMNWWSPKLQKSNSDSSNLRRKSGPECDAKFTVCKLSILPQLWKWTITRI